MNRLLWPVLALAILGGCQDNRTGSSEGLSSSQPASSLEFLDNLDSAQKVNRADLLRGLLMARNGDAGPSFAENASEARDAGLGKWEDPTRVVDIGEASSVAALAVNGPGVKTDEAMTALAARGLIGTGRNPTDPITGAELIALLDGVESMLKSGDKLAVTPIAAKPVPAPAPASGGQGESFEAFGGPAATTAAPPPPKPAVAAAEPAAPADVPTVRPEPLPDMKAESASKVKKKAWAPSKPVPQKPE